MGNGLVSDLYADRGSKTNYSPLTYTEIFEESCPYYMSIGMSYADFWDGDPKLAVYYKKAHELRNDRINEELWLQGLYVYTAILDASPVLHAFAKRGTKPQEYPKEPYPVTANAQRRVKEDEAKKAMEKNKELFTAFAEAFNKKISNGKEVKDDA